MTNRLYVGNLGVQVTADDLTALFAGAGQVVSTHIVMDRGTGQPKGFAFVEMAQESEALQAIALYNGHMLYERALILSSARPSEPDRRGRQDSPMPRFREIKHKRRGGADRHRFH
ncbi:MAG: RNA-binding protein [Chloroflexi bacterium]|nr:RNA-binding protein [Chloroflexota bacterium]MCL5952573.1 RNA-binding protein [Chloroflexota bacterium]